MNNLLLYNTMSDFNAAEDAAGYVDSIVPGVAYVPEGDGSVFYNKEPANITVQVRRDDGPTAVTSITLSDFDWNVEDDASKFNLTFTDSSGEAFRIESGSEYVDSMFAPVWGSCGQGGEGWIVPDGYYLPVVHFKQSANGQTVQFCATGMYDVCTDPEEGGGV